MLTGHYISLCYVQFEDVFCFFVSGEIFGEWGEGELYSSCFDEGVEYVGHDEGLMSFWCLFDCFSEAYLYFKCD